MHTISRLSNTAQQMILACHAAGRDISVVVSVLDGGIARWTKEHSPNTVTVVRPTWPDNPPMVNGLFRFNLAWFNATVDPIRSFLPWITYVQLYNEKFIGNGVTDDRLKALRDFEWACGREAIRQGFHITHLNLAMGNLSDDRHAPKEGDQFAVLAPMLDEMCRAGNILCYHGYNAVATPLDPEPGFEHNAGRWIHWCERLPSLRVGVFEELVPEWKDSQTGQDARLVSPEQTVWQIQTLDRLINAAVQQGRIQAVQFVGGAPFTGNPGDRWKNFNMDNVYPAQQAYLLA